MNSSVYVQYAPPWLIDMPRRRSAATHLSLYFFTILLHSATSLSTPTPPSISSLPPSMPSSFCACSSTGRPCVSQPALNTTRAPRIVVYLYQ